MRKFFRDLSITMLFVGLVIAVLEIAIGRTSNEYSYKDWYMTENADRIKILLLGNSLFANSFDPHVLGDSVFDGASDARSLYYDEMVMKKYAPKMSNLEVVLIPLIVSMGSNPSSSLFLTFPYARFMGIPVGHNPLQYSALFSGHLTYHSLKPIQVSKHIVQTKHYGHDYHVDSIGYSPLFHIWNGRLRNVPIATYDETVSNREMFKQRISKMAEYCESRGVRIVCILPPASNIYINDIDPRIYDTLESVMNCLKRDYNIEYKFYYNDEDFRSDSLYADELHLNHLGATKIAEKVKRDFGL